MKRCLENVQGVLLGAMIFFLALSLLAMPQNSLLADEGGPGTIANCVHNECDSGCGNGTAIGNCNCVGCNCTKQGCARDDCNCKDVDLTNNVLCECANP